MSHHENPISDLEYDLLTVVQSKAEAVRAYQKYMDDARQRNSQECVQLFQRLLDEDTSHLQEARRHLQEVMAGRMGSGSQSQSGGSSQMGSGSQLQSGGSSQQSQSGGSSSRSS